VIASDQGSEQVETASAARFGWRLVRADRGAFGISLLTWVVFFTTSLPSGLALKAAIDALDSHSSSLWGWLAACAAIEGFRWAVLLPAIVQWHGAWVFWHTVPRVNMLSSLVHDPGPVTGRLPGSPGEAVSRFRDDAHDISTVVDVWLDVAASGLTTVVGLTIITVVSPPAALAIALPIAAVVWFGALLGPRLRAWRLAERKATAQVTSFIGDSFGAIAAIKVSAAEGAVAERFASLGRARAVAARRDQVGSQLAQVLGGITANAGLGLALVVTAPAMRRGDLSPGDVGLLAFYAGALGHFPRIAARWSAWQRQAEVSAARLGRLIVDHDPDGASKATPTWLRHGPPPFDDVDPPAPGARRGRDRFERLDVRELVVELDGVRALDGIDLSITRGQLVVVTGPVGAGKSVLVRALLGLVPSAGGEVQWNEEVVAEPSTWFVPPRASYVPQVPRLFSEPLASTVLMGWDRSGLERALRLACLDDDLAELPDGVETMVGPKGVRLSGGQIQRAATARALVRRPELLVIDDLSSALDVTTEARLWDQLFEATGGDLTVLAVSHRPRVLDRADQVIELRAGRRA
jgi:ATP-binding cassette subfamily B protein